MLSASIKYIYMMEGKSHDIHHKSDHTHLIKHRVIHTIEKE